MTKLGWWWLLLGALALYLVLGCGCRPPPSEWPAFAPVEVTRSQVGSRRLVLPSAYEAFLRGQIAFNDGNYPQALRDFQTALRSDPESAYLMTWVALTELSRGRLDAARASIDRALGQDGCSEFALCTAASILEEEDDDDGAMRSLQRAIECEPRQPEAYYQLAVLLEENGAQQRAESIYRDLLEPLPRQARAHRELARLAMERGDGDEAASRLSALLALEPWHSEAVLQLATLSFSRGDTASARSLLQTVVRRSPSDDEARRLLVRVLLAAGDTAEAARHLDAMRPDLNDVVGATEVARFYLKARRYERAESEARRVLEQDSSQPVCRYVLVAALRGLGRVNEARRRASATPPGSVGADRVYREAGLALWEAGRFDEARVLLETLLASRPSAPRSRETLARLLETQGLRDQAETVLRAGSTGRDRLSLAVALLEWGRPVEVAEVLAPLENDGDEEVLVGALAVRARALLALDERHDDALEMARRALQGAPHEAEFLALVGALEVRQGRHDEGLAMLERASRRGPASARIAADHALGLARASRCREALSTAQRASRLSPSGATRDQLDTLLTTLRAECSDDVTSEATSSP